MVFSLERNCMVALGPPGWPNTVVIESFAIRSAGMIEVSGISGENAYHFMTGI